MKDKIELTRLAKEKTLLLPGVLLVIISFSLIGLFILFQKLGEVREQITTLEQRILVLSSKQDLLSRLAKAQIQSQVNLSTKALPEKSTLPTVIARIKDAAADSGVTILQVRVAGAEGEKSGSLSSVDIQLDCEGKVTDVDNFLSEIGRSLPIIFVERGRLSSPFGLAQTTLTLRTFWERIPSSLPPIDQPIQSLTQEEQQLIANLQNFKEQRTAFVVPLVSAVESRPNPFSF